jgi:hypothetical protein
MRTNGVVIDDDEIGGDGFSIEGHRGDSGGNVGWIVDDNVDTAFPH